MIHNQCQPPFRACHNGVTSLGDGTGRQRLILVRGLGASWGTGEGDLLQVL